MRKLTELGIAERERREAELEAQRINEETQARLVRERAERKRLTALAENPEIQARYQVFLAKGRYSFAQNKVINATAFAPSYNALRILRITHDPETFAIAAGGYQTQLKGGLYDRSTWYFNKNDRPLWASYPRTDNEWKELNARFKEFQELAPIWRDMGVLSP
ncbi:MAG: hypothetical protein KKB50_14865 [Planctomycetes bacterium]|nr:hypothetical protein [Planctomycetota bacterium]